MQNVESKIQSLEVVVSQSGLAPTEADHLKLSFTPLFDSANQWAARVDTLSVTSVEQVREMKLARESRLALKEIRCNAERKRKELNESSQRRTKAVNGIYNVLEYLIVPLEEKLMDMEQFAERKEATRLNEQLKQRKLALAHYGPVLLDDQAIRNMAEDAFQFMLEGAELLAAAKVAAEAKALAEQKEREAAALAERERVRLENERLRAEAAAKEAALAKEREAVEAARKEAEAKAKAALKAAQDKAKKEREEAMAKARSEQAARDAAMQAERQRLEELAKAERDERQRVQRVLQQVRDDEAAAAAKVRAEQAAVEAARRRAAAAPDKAKLEAYLAAILAVEVPEMGTTEGGNALHDILDRLNTMHARSMQNISTL